jgi:hypothetical protein
LQVCRKRRNRVRTEAAQHRSRPTDCRCPSVIGIYVFCCHRYIRVLLLYEWDISTPPLPHFSHLYCSTLHICTAAHYISVLRHTTYLHCSTLHIFFPHPFSISQYETRGVVSFYCHCTHLPLQFVVSKCNNLATVFTFPSFVCSQINQRQQRQLYSHSLNYERFNISAPNN